MFLLPDLPYAADALAPVVSADALRLHHSRLHRGYVTQLNTLLAELPGVCGPLESVIDAASALADPALGRSAGQCWIHSLSWECMSPVPTTPAAPLSAEISAQFGGLPGLRSAFVAAGVAQFGSGWAWLVKRADGSLDLVSTSNAATPLTLEGQTPLLTCDVWEHAYYVDYRNDRAAYLKAWFDALPNWSLGASQLEAARGRGAVWTHP